MKYRREGIFNTVVAPLAAARPMTIVVIKRAQHNVFMRNFFLLMASIW